MPGQAWELGHSLQGAHGLVYTHGGSPVTGLQSGVGIHSKAWGQSLCDVEETSTLVTAHTAPPRRPGCQHPGNSHLPSAAWARHCAVQDQTFSSAPGAGVPFPLVHEGSR